MADFSDTPQMLFRESEINYQNGGDNLNFGGAVVSDLPVTPFLPPGETQASFYGTSALPLVQSIEKTSTGVTVSGILGSVNATADGLLNIFKSAANLKNQYDVIQTQSAIQKTALTAAEDKAKLTAAANKANAETGVGFAGLGLFPLNSTTGPQLLYVIAAGIGLYFLVKK